MSEIKYYPKAVWKLAINISVSCFIYCFAISCMNSCTDNIAETLGWKDSFILRSIFTTLFPVGSAIGSIIGAPISSKIGIRRTIIISNFVFIFSSLICIIPNNFTFGAGRFVTGIVGGIFITIPAVFINEITPDPMTGQVGTLVQQACNISFLCSFAFGLIVPTENLENNSLNYLWMLILFFPAFIGFYQIYYFLNEFKYENPGWLIKQGRTDEAKSALRKIYEESSVEVGIKRLRRDTPNQGKVTDPLLNTSPTVVQMLCTRPYRKMMRNSIALNMGQQTIGGMVMLLYSTSIFESMGGGRFFARLMTLVEGVFIVLSGGVSIFLLKRFGKKPLIVYGTLSVAFIWFLLGLFNGVISVSVNVKVCMVFLYFLVSLSTMGAVFWAYIGEICNDKAVSIGLAFNFTTTIVLSFTFPVLSHYFGLSNCFFMFGVLSLILVFYQIFDMIETRGLTKQEINSKIMLS